ncbi:GNVR domain-containing protein [Sphingomonas sp.]|uniref:GNVR domain-containing protein n=1 Tax=Sphingomonas sp. TaxID=28214 RepID=UPI0025D141E8|nr:GNVR domain-containing protein [Sphingomonas sp.]
MSLMQFLRILWVWRVTIVLAAAACLIAGIAAALVRPKTYTAEARVLLDLLKPDPVTGQEISSSFARAYLPTQTELVRDYRVAGRVVDKLGWTRSPELRADYEASNAQGVDFRRWLAGGVAENTKPYNVEGSNVLVIGYTASDPETAAKMADAVRDAYIEETLQTRRSEAAGNAAWFERQLRDVRDKLIAAEQRKVAFERANNIVLLDKDNDADAARLQALSGQTPPSSTIVGGGGASDPNAGQLAAIDAKIAAASTTLGDNHPVLQELRQQRAAIVASSRASAAPAPRLVLGGGGGDVNSARAKVLAQRDKVETAKRLETDVEVLRDQYAKVNARAAELRQQAASNESGITLMDSAVPPRQSDGPKSMVLIAGSAGLGLALGVMLSLLIELLYRRVRGADDFRALDVPLLGVVQCRAVAL